MRSEIVKHLLWIGTGLLIVFILMRYCGSPPHSPQTVKVGRDTVRDTIRVPQPKAGKQIIVRHDTVNGNEIGRRSSDAPGIVDTSGHIPRGGCQTKDSNTHFIVPISQSIYQDSNYTAYVSGFHTTLDSLKFVRSKVTVTRTVTKYKQRHWGIGLQIGYGITTKGLQPYLGVGGFWRLW